MRRDEHNESTLSCGVGCLGLVLAFVVLWLFLTGELTAMLWEAVR